MAALAVVAALLFVAVRRRRSSQPVTWLSGLGDAPDHTGTDADLDLIFGQIDALHELAFDPESSRKSGRVYDFSIRWGTFVAGRLHRLHYYHGRGELTPAQDARFAELRQRLEESAPLIERFGLASPQVASSP